VAWWSRAADALSGDRPWGASRGLPHAISSPLANLSLTA
jgi:hypothetical protein